MTYYDDIAEGYEELHKEEQLQKVKILQEYFHPHENEKLLDVGCGSGISTEPWLSKRYGIDPSKKLIALARKKKGITFEVASAEKIPYPDHFFDYVISVTALHHTNTDKAIAEIKRVGKNCFGLSVLKKGPHSLLKIIRQKFPRVIEVEEDKDIIFISDSAQESPI